MDALATTIVTAILHTARKSGALPTREARPTARALRAACESWAAEARTLVTPDLKEAPAWAASEMKILELGRALDLVMRKYRVWRGKGEVLDAAAEIVRVPAYGRGRRSWVATLGEHGESAYGAALASLLSEPELAGYAIKALLRTGDNRYVELVRVAGESDRLWIRNAARIYIERFAQKATACQRAPRVV